MEDRKPKTSRQPPSTASARSAGTRRGYTLRLRGAHPKDNRWREALWTTHVTVNKGAKVFGDWFLTLRGGLDHRLAEDAPPRDRKNRRVLLALSWISVEDQDGAPKEHIIESAAVLDTLSNILSTRGVEPGGIAAWLEDCRASLTAQIRHDAVRVNRSAAFDEFTRRTGGAAERGYAARSLFRFLELKSPYFALPSLDDDDEINASSKEEKPLANEAPGWLCDNWGAGKKSDKGGIAEKLEAFAAVKIEDFIGKPGASLISEFCHRAGVETPKSGGADLALKELCKVVGWKGRKSAARMSIEGVAATSILGTDLAQKLIQKLRKESGEKLAESKLKIPPWMATERARIEAAIGIRYRDEKDNTFEFAVMLDHALRKVSTAHSWTKKAEAQRGKFEVDATKLDRVPGSAKQWLDKFCDDRATGRGDGRVPHPSSRH